MDICDSWEAVQGQSTVLKRFLNMHPTGKKHIYSAVRKRFSYLCELHMESVSASFPSTITDVSVYSHPFLSQPEEAKATEELDSPTNPAEPDPAEIWKKDFQCQWYKSAEGDVSDQLSLKDGAPAGVGVEQNARDVLQSTAAPSAASMTRTAPVSGSPKPSPEVATDGGPRPLGGPDLTALLLLVAAGLCVDP